VRRKAGEGLMLSGLNIWGSKVQVSGFRVQHLCALKSLLGQRPVRPPPPWRQPGHVLRSRPPERENKSYCLPRNTLSPLLRERERESSSLTIHWSESGHLCHGELVIQLGGQPVS
jgi:hypothetical protein